MPADLGSVATPNMEWNPDEVAGASETSDMASEARQKTRAAISEKMSLPGRHPTVEKALDGMPGDMQSLKDKERAAKEARAQLAGSVGEAFSHMNDAMPIKHAIAEKKAQIRVEEKKMKVLAHDNEHLVYAHSSLVNSLHRVLEPKMMFARQRLQKRERSFEEEERTAMGWQKKKEQLKRTAIELIKERHSSKDSLLQAEAEVAEAKQKEQKARRKFEQQRQHASREIQSYRYADTRLKAQTTREQVAKEQVLAAKESATKLEEVMAMEAQKVENSLAGQRETLQKKMHKVEAAHGRSEGELARLEEEYRRWEERQRQRAAEVVKQSQDTAEKSQAFANHERQVLDNAQTKVARDAESKSDWAWDGDFSQPAGSGPSDVNFSD
jgi:hypothetical protein